MSNTYPEYPNTTFPDSMDSFPTYLNIQQSDMTNILGYQQAMLAKDFNLATVYYANIVNASQKVIGADTLNAFSNAIMALENFYATDIQSYVSEKQEEWQAIINLFSYIGEYNYTVQYFKNNMVLYTDKDGNNYMYINIYSGQTPIGTPPINTTYWRQFTIRGIQGKTSSDTSTFFFEWEETQQYVIGNIVSTGNCFWYAKANNNNQPPVNGSEYWELMLESPQVFYPVQAEEPTYQPDGNFWFRTLN